MALYARTGTVYINSKKFCTNLKIRVVGLGPVDPKRWKPNIFIFRRPSSVSSFELNGVTLSHRHWTLYLERITELRQQEWPNKVTVSCSKFSQGRSRSFGSRCGRAFVLHPLMSMRLFEISRNTRPAKRYDIPVHLKPYVLFVACLTKSLYQILRMTEVSSYEQTTWCNHQWRLHFESRSPDC